MKSVLFVLGLITGSVMQPQLALAWDTAEVTGEYCSVSIFCDGNSYISEYSSDSQLIQKIYDSNPKTTYCVYFSRQNLEWVQGEVTKRQKICSPMCTDGACSGDTKPGVITED